MNSSAVLDSPIEYLKGVGPTKGELLKKELGVFTLRGLLLHFPFRYVDKTQFHKVKDLNESIQFVNKKDKALACYGFLDNKKDRD